MRTKKPRILVVEDEDIVALDIEIYLQRAGYNVAPSSSSGEEAIVSLSKEKADLVLMDIQLGGKLDGISTANKIRSCYDIPVLYLTAYSDSTTLKRAKITQPYGYIVKPFSEKALISNIEIALYKHAQEKKVQNKQQMFSTAINKITNGVLFINNDGLISFLNPTAKVLTGWKEESIYGKPLTDIIIFKNEEMIKNIESKVFKDGITVCLVDQISLKESRGSEIPVDATLSPNWSFGGDISGAVMVFQEISEYRRTIEIKEKIIKNLQETLNENKKLADSLTICPWCKKGEGKEGKWKDIEFYILEYLSIDVEQNTCPDCIKGLFLNICKKLGEDPNDRKN